MFDFLTSNFLYHIPLLSHFCSLPHTYFADILPSSFSILHCLSLLLPCVPGWLIVQSPPYHHGFSCTSASTHASPPSSVSLHRIPFLMSTLPIPSYFPYLDTLPPASPLCSKTFHVLYTHISIPSCTPAHSSPLLSLSGSFHACIAYICNLFIRPFLHTILDFQYIFPSILQSSKSVRKHRN